MGRSSRQKPRRLAEKLAAIRTRLDLNQTQMIKRLGEIAISLRAGHIAEFENDKREPSLLILLRYSQIAGLPMEVLVDDSIELPEQLPSEQKLEWIMVKRDS